MSYDIELPNPFWFGIKINESEDRLPSIGCEVELKLEMPRGIFSYSAKDIWFECSVFDEFLVQLERLKTGDAGKAEFYDMDREIVLSFTKEEIQLSVHRIHSEIGSGYMEFKSDFDRELVIQHIEHIESFAKWW
ncbi:hypothetical protein IT970_07770 [Pseudoalteromonas sp. A41-2]|uniref:hypothetical protein n=1 Tax=Pseudoalteromonas sp. A41-2 TaxID=2785910 RepID=UPI0018CB0546|nr:hypothetical protein [Pseudoalteromonas sp. A41-2]QPL44295.1 hypothetical protein IT970_07770 [Pseudoalteromonas sp. A41-2]